MTPYSSTSKRRVGFGDYWWFILTLIPIINWLPLLIAGIRTKKFKWIAWSVFYLAIILSAYIFNTYKNMMGYNELIDSINSLLSIAFIITWVISIFHTFSIRKEYLYYLSQIPEKFVTSKSISSGTQYTQVRRNLGRHGRVISQIERLRNQIEFELKKTKTDYSTKKATSQIVSSSPLTKMIYEKTTGENPCNLKIIGIRIFGPPRAKKQGKIPRKEKFGIPVKKTEGLFIGHFCQNKQNENLTSLSNIYRKTKERFD